MHSPTCYQQLATVAILIVWALAQSRRDGHRSLVTPERVLSEYNILDAYKHCCCTANVCHAQVGRDGHFRISNLLNPNP